MLSFVIPLICFCFLLAGCNGAVIRGERVGGPWSSSRTEITFTSADVRALVERTRPVGGVPQVVLCTEPSPDVAKALETLARVSASGGNGVGAGELGFTGSNAEAAMQLAGRSTALLALRDGLYRACEAYSNGVIGQDAYALILARYGDLMTTLFLGEDVAATVPGAETVIAYPANAMTSADGTPESSKGQPPAKAKPTVAVVGRAQALVRLIAAASPVPPARRSVAGGAAGHVSRASGAAVKSAGGRANGSGAPEALLQMQ